MWLHNHFDSRNTKIACRVKKNRIKNDSIFYFGNESEVISNEYIVEEKLQQLAKDIDSKYTNLSARDDITIENYWDELAQIELYSNYYSAMNIRFKLNLLGLDLTKDSDVVGLTKEDFQKIYNLDSTENYFYEQYFDTKIRNVIAYSEKLRWNAFYLLNDYRPMPKSMIKFNEIEKEGKTKYELNRKDHILKLHACITSHQGLDELHDHIIKHVTNVNKLEIKDIDFYKNDYMLFDNPKNNLLDNLIKLGYKIIYLKK
jgi:hypothetical protein